MATVDSKITPLELASLRPLAEQGDAEAQFELAEYYKGKFANPFPDEAKAAIWYLKSARQGNVVAQNALGLMYDLGVGLPQNSFEAVKWYRLAANNENAPAMFALAKKYGAGDGVQRDDAQALLWVTHANSRFEKLQSDLADKEQRVMIKNAIAYYNDLTSRLIPKDLFEAQRLAREWRSHQTITAVDEESSKETPDVSVAREGEPHQTITAVDEENSNETSDVWVRGVIDAYIDRTSLTPQHLSVDRSNSVVHNNTPDVSEAREWQPHETITAVDEESSKEPPDVSVAREGEPHETITAVDEENSNETPDVSVGGVIGAHIDRASFTPQHLSVDRSNSVVHNNTPDVSEAREWQPHETITEVDEESSKEPPDVSVGGVIGAYIDRASLTPQHLSVDRSNSVVGNNGRTGWFYLIGSVPIIGLIIFCILVVFPSELSNNMFGLNQLTSENPQIDTAASSAIENVPFETDAGLAPVIEDAPAETPELAAQIIDRLLQSIAPAIENAPVETAAAPEPAIEDAPVETSELATLTIAPAIENATVETNQAIAPTLADAQTAYDRADYSAAVSQFQFLANQGDVLSQYSLGVMYANGQGVQQDAAEAVGFYRMAAAQGYAAAQYELGRMYANGQGVRQNVADAMRWYRLAAEQGHEVAQSILADASALTLEDPLDELADASALTLEDPPDELADASAPTLEDPLDELAEASALTLEDPPDELADASALTLEEALAAYERADYSAAVSIFQLLANQGDARAQHNLAVMYGDGLGVPQDETESMRWYRMAADQGVARAQYELGVMYENGRGVQQDDAEAMRWYRLAAEQEFAPAQARINAP